jgi:hypothetical protein
VPLVHVYPRMQLLPQHGALAPPQVVGARQKPALHTSSPGHGSLPAQHARLSAPQVPMAPPSVGVTVLVQVPEVHAYPRMQLPPQQASPAPPQVVGVRQKPALHTSSPGHGSLPAQHARLSAPQAVDIPESAVPERQKPPMHVSPLVVQETPMVQHAWSTPPHVADIAWQVPAVHA